MPKVSVLMPVYRTNERYLREAVESVLAQSFTDFEFLILDDCPSESRESVVFSYKDERIFYYKNEKNLGISASRNKLLSLAKGEYLAVVDHDDINMKERFEKQVAFLDANEDVGVVGSSFVEMKGEKLISLPLSDREIKFALISNNSSIQHPTCMMRKSVLDATNVLYNELFSPCEDYKMWCDLIPFTKFANLSEPLLRYRNYSNTTEANIERMKNIWAGIRKINEKRFPELCAVISPIKKVTRVRICGLPFLKIIEELNKKSFYLFNRLLICKIQKEEKYR